ncbi:FAST kinase domain-containing protein 2, mitochondrial isoform X2 [Monomorium pharaonis]|nr:FAST kinase domain-containing protein 2, mitochondrial isoform X2 [Monomorium pharaonis]
MERNDVTIDIKPAYKCVEILEKAAKNYTDMTLHDAIDTIFILYKASKNMEDVQIIKQHSGFVHLCEVLNKNIRLMKINEIISSLKMLRPFKMPTNCILIQSLLQIIRVNINELSIQDIINITALLKRMDNTPLRDALLIALPIVFEAQLPTKLDLDNIFILKKSLRFISENNINNPEVQNTILKSIHKFENTLNVQTAWSIFCSLCISSHLSPLAFELLFNIQKILIKDAKQLSVLDIIMVLHRLVLVTERNEKYGCKFYNEALVDAFVNSALSAEISFNNSINLLKLLNDLNYAHIPFLEYLAAKCFEHPNLLKDASYFKISIFLEGLINADYKPVFWDVIRDAILANKVEKVFNKSIIKFVLHLIALDCYSPTLISQVFSQIIKVNESMKNIIIRELLLLYQSVKTLYPMYTGPWPSQDILDHAISIHKTLLNPILPTSSLKTTLEQALGGPQYVHNDLRTKLGHYIDHVIVMRKGGYSIAINTDTSNRPNITYIEDIQTPSESQMILIFNLPDAAYAVNSQRIKSTWLLKIKSAEALTKSNAITINSSSWMKLTEYERLLYLVRAIRLKCEDDSFLTK